MSGYPTCTAAAQACATFKTCPPVPPLPQAMASTLAALHSVRPADVGLADYGKLSGYNKRQVRMIMLCCVADTQFSVWKGGNAVAASCWAAASGRWGGCRCG